MPKRNLWITTQDLQREVGEEGSGNVITVPAGFVFDGATIPMVFGQLFQRAEPCSINAACLHDWLYIHKDDYDFTRAEADKMFREACIACNTPERKAWCMYIGIRLGGWLYWERFI